MAKCLLRLRDYTRSIGTEEPASTAAAGNLLPDVNSLYFDDTYRVGRAIVNFGVRYDYSKGSFPSLPFLDAAGRETGQMSAGERRRLPLEHVLAARRRQLPVERVGPHAGEGRTTAATTRRWRRTEFRPAVPSITPSFEFGFDAAGNRMNFVQVSSNANLRIDPDFKAPYSDQFIVQFEQEVMTEPRRAGELRAQARRRLRRVAGHRRRRTCRCRTSTTQGIDATGNTVMVYRLLSNPADRVFLQTNPDGMYMRYNGVTMMAHEAHVE